MNFGIMFFSGSDAIPGDKYRLLRLVSRFADTHDFCCIWTPERHFHEFGGLFPNPAVTSAALRSRRHLCSQIFHFSKSLEI